MANPWLAGGWLLTNRRAWEVLGKTLRYLTNFSRVAWKVPNVYTEDSHTVQHDGRRLNMTLKYEAGRKHYGFLTASFLKLILG
jgi:hypothetical protein